MDAELSLELTDIDKHSQKNPPEKNRRSSEVKNVSLVSFRCQEGSFVENKVRPGVEKVSEQNDSKSAAIGKKWNSFVEASSLHGLQYIFTSRTLVRRSIWTFFLLAGIGWFTFQSSRLLTKYLERPVTTKVTVEYEDTSEFPSVTICNFNPVRKSVVTSSGFGEVLMHLLAPFLPAGSSANQSIDWRKYEGFNTTELFVRGAHRIEDTLLNCSWGGEMCYARNFTPTMTSMGLCYTFNSGKDGQPILKVHQAGTHYGLRLLLNVQQEEYFGLLTYLAGLKVLIHHHDTLPLVDELGFSVAPGTSTFVNIRKQRVRNLPFPYKSNCTNESVSNIPGYTKYTFSSCLLTCETAFIVDKCGCKSPGMPSHAKVCTPREIVECIFKERGIFRLGNYPCVCPVPCDEVSYKPALSYATYPNEDFLARVLEASLPGGLASLTPDQLKLVVEHFRKNQLEIRVFYQELNYQLVEQQPAYGYESLLGEIGGQVGLCVGASLLTLLEFCDVIFTVLRIRLGFR